MNNSVTIIDVAPRDGFQSVVPIIALKDKLAIITALANAGLKHIEVGAFVHPKAIPQMADIQPLLDNLASSPANADRFESIVLVPNERGAILADKQACQRINFVISVSETHNLKNVRKTLVQSLEELAKVQAIVSQSSHLTLRVSLATSFDCPFDGAVDETLCLSVLQKVTALCPTAQVAICDTTGKAHPFAVEHLFNKAFEFLDKDVPVIFHGHDTYGLGVANVAAAYKAGVRIFDSAVAGFGGCPFAPGASGNVATEDIVYFFESAGIDTNIDSTKLKIAINLAEQIEGAQLGGRIRLIKPINQ